MFIPDEELVLSKCELWNEPGTRMLSTWFRPRGERYGRLRPFRNRLKTGAPRCGHRESFSQIEWLMDRSRSSHSKPGRFFAAARRSGRNLLNGQRRRPRRICERRTITDGIVVVARGCLFGLILVAERRTRIGTGFFALINKHKGIVRVVGACVSGPLFRRRTRRETCRRICDPICGPIVRPKVLGRKWFRFVRPVTERGTYEGDNSSIVPQKQCDTRLD